MKFASAESDRHPASDTVATTGGPSLLAALSGRRPNSFGFLRWVMAVMVVLDHSYPLSGLNHGSDPVWAWSRSQDSLGGIAVAGFFVISGFLVTRSWFASRTGRQFLWKRFLRIFPGYWVCLIVTAFGFAVLAWIHERGTLTSAFLRGPGTPLRYLTSNALLHIHQWDIDNLLNHTPYAHTGYAIAFDGSLWTLIYEFKCYLLLALIGFVGLLVRRKLVVALTAAFYLLSLLWLVNPAWDSKLLPALSDPYVARFGFLFFIGSTLALYAEEVAIDDRLGVGTGIVAILCLHYGGWFMIGYPAMAYFLLWLAARLPMHWWDRFGDLSYGTYIYAFPVQMTLADHGLQKHGIAAFFVASLFGTTVVALLSWHLIEKRALKLKGLKILQGGLHAGFRQRSPQLRRELVPPADVRDLEPDAAGR